MKKLAIYKNDPWLRPYSGAIDGRHADALAKEADLTQESGSLSDFANAHKYFGLHRVRGGWVFREWAPNATAIFLTGDFSRWRENPEFELRPIGGGVWEGWFPADAIQHGQYYKMSVHWPGGQGERIPAYATRVVQAPGSNIFSAQVWHPRAYKWATDGFKPDTRPLMIYECHIGMAQQTEGVGTYAEFRDKILPRVAKDGYNAIQIMAIQEHPYYGSFGYHVSSFFAPSSRFGTPEDLKSLIDAAHGLGIAVIMDIVHSHAVKNVNEGLGNLDGTRELYFYPGARGEHPAWDSYCFDYGKNEVLHFLL
ncbi:MAG: 1,4-alpha-glucan-branching enzyme, partial [Muribaculaceae bacterium]|nr:1,4-alpha-glucan-branching enzyme [Muribaculaceae bacterium]